MIPRQANQLSDNACALRTQIFGDRLLFTLRFVETHKFYIDCSRSPLFVSASRDVHWALSFPVGRSKGCRLGPHQA
jgi:hypothetical protein